MTNDERWISIVPACRGKVCHPSPQVAFGEAAKLRGRHRQPGVIHYKCPHCGWWHTGRMVKDEPERAHD